MRQRIIVALVILTIPWGTHAATIITPDSTTMTELRSVLQMVPPGSTVFAQADSVKVHLDEYDRLLRQAQEIARSGRYQVDVIGQQHDAPNLPFHHQLEVHCSQWRTRQLLDSLRYEVIGIEGFGMDRVTWPGLLHEVMMQMANNGNPMSTAEDTLSCQKFLIYEAGHVDDLYYFVAHPSAHLTGIDEDRLHYLMAVTMTLPGLHSNPLDPDVLRFFGALSKARCEVAAARFIIHMQKNRLRRGVIIMGLLHQDEFAEIFSRYNIRSRYFPTTAGDNLGPQWWK